MSIRGIRWNANTTTGIDTANVGVVVIVTREEHDTISRWCQEDKKDSRDVMKDLFWDGYEARQQRERNNPIPLVQQVGHPTPPAIVPRPQPTPQGPVVKVIPPLMMFPDNVSPDLLPPPPAFPQRPPQQFDIGTLADAADIPEE